ncbi:hypothetical protein PI124_g2476 [Phytophthora idaei]|nr:hypothetical protein PI125_g2096 [Phytophthora idaei]KAG3171418.1 hypothetical protein PI126_g1905 [Phytophthora idaei]KAG3252945.1 hypothetical protein PI124_g2476 [Phytophthora idaei]
MGHTDGLSRLYPRSVVLALRMADILNDTGDRRATNQVGERGLGLANLLNPSTTEGADADVEVWEEGVGRDEVDSENVAPEETTKEAVVKDQEEDETDGAVRLIPSPEDAFELDSEMFVEEQAGTPWMQAMKAFLANGALALDPQLRVQTLRMAPHFVVRNGIRVRKVYL